MSIPIGFIPAGLTLLLCVGAIPLPTSIRSTISIVQSPFKTFISLDEAETFIAAKDNVDNTAARPAVPLWRTVVLSWVALLETLFWLGIGCYQIVATTPGNAVQVSESIAIAVSWFYATLKPIVAPALTPPCDLFFLYTTHLVVATVFLGSALYEHSVQGAPLPSTWSLFAMILNLAAILGLLSIVVLTPLAVPGSGIKEQNVSPEDYTNLWKWLTFDWVRPLIQLGRNTTLNEGDVWNLSSTMRVRPVFTKFQQIQHTSLVYRLWRANSLDLLMDFILTMATIVGNYAGPFFLRRILAGIEDGSRERLSQALIFAILAFFAHVLKAEVELQHLWYGRRASTRIKSELQAAIYEKAMKRKDYSGVVAKGADEGKKDDGSRAEKDNENKPKAGADIGKIVNLMSTDTERISMAVSAIYYLYGAPFEIVLGSVFLYQLLGLSAFSGFIVIVLAWPVSRWITQRAGRIGRAASNAKDKRTSIVNELLGAVRFIKFFAWEERWIERVMEARRNELDWLRRGQMNNLLFHLVYVFSPVFITLISFFTYIAFGNQLTVSTAFTALSLYTMIRDPLSVIPIWIMQIIYNKIALQRIETYLNEDEVDAGVSSLKLTDTFTDVDQGLAIVNGTFKWNEVEEGADSKAQSQTENVSEESDETDVQSSAGVSIVGDHDFKLRDIDITFPEGKLTLITGPTASGKTALLLALLGEMTILSGHVSIHKATSKVDSDGLVHATSYASQSPWLRHQSIKDNILFGNTLDQKRYEAVVEACALKPDFEVLEDGDATEIGARGINLSGGQKARVALARAVYASTKYVLLDDPLSAVDSHTARHIFERLLCGSILKNRTVLLVTHHVSLVLPGANYVVRLSDGRVDLKGTIDDIRERGLLDEVWRGVSQTEGGTMEKSEELAAEVEAENSGGEQPDDGDAAKRKTPRKFVEDEQREIGAMKWHIYRTYLAASSYWTWAIILLLIALNQTLSIGEKFWIKIWGEAYAQYHIDHPPSNTASSFSSLHHETMTGFDSSIRNIAIGLPATRGLATYVSRWPNAQEHPMFYVGIYAAISLGTAFVDVSFVVAQLVGSLRASRLLFERLLVTVVRSTMRWHDVTPQGRILNRFTKDMDTVDSSLSLSMLQMTTALGGFLAAVLAVTIIFPLFLLPAAVIGFIYFYLAIGYLNTGRDLRRIESNSRSPIFSGFQELLEGVVVVRAFSVEKKLLQEFFEKIDLNSNMSYMFWMTNRWLSFNFDLLGASAVFATTLLSLTQYVSAGVAGLCITSAMTFSDRIYYACRYWTGLELNLNSVERVVEYLDLPQEPPAIIDFNRPPAYWPSSSTTGAMLSVEDLVIKYAPDLLPVLHGISFSLKPGERVGLLGRTGSGKSTLAMSLLRFVDPAAGRIIIDGIDISTIGLHDLRSRITFIPQDAALFSGTLRENLDPFNEHTDEECLDVLRRVHMITESTYNSPIPSGRHSIDGTESETPVVLAEISSDGTTLVDARTIVTLQTPVSPAGANFSQGQRQLVALARAMLRRSSIIILDEATSSIDFETDAKIQRTIREEFGGSLLLTIAHRLRTVIDYDRLIVLDEGRIVEFDTPYTLIGKEDGIFRHMCLRSGMFAELEGIARVKAEQTGNA
ncbi:P-loop containing nucleoside triphosphate hydrolase protein [Neolentinus lepideus HHB14362 ss-1]|uniref:p-loop containing nucleoside triphosphate hydrolase protein n=1 Tax=Neolentinus lepideus HHB14362 ss-1 TaxID=1314782 RepID=A0A165QGU2_9AGAM|nr:P-loop containing nucleoside triphosphate hydrolase protein [Neolentinus lepideus HHB14362 ss-1]